MASNLFLNLKEIPMRKLAALALATIALIPPFASAQSGTSTVVEKVRFCQLRTSLCFGRTPPEFRAWENNSVGNSTQRETYLSRYNQPAKDQTEHIVFLASGHRDSAPFGFRDSRDNLLTGQRDWNTFHPTDERKTLPISTDSIAYRLFSEGIYSRHNTFVGLGYDSRYEGGMTEETLEKILNAHYEWLVGKVNRSQLKTVYIAGHSRGGVLALRLARKFKQNFPNVIVSVDAFDPVARVRHSWGEPDRDQLGMDEENEWLNNPTVNYPRRWWNNDNVGNWAWKTDLRNQFPHKNYFNVSNYINGGKMPHWLNLPFDTRALTHQSGEERFLELGWLYQEWFPVASDGAGHVDIVRDVSVISLALMRLKERLDLYGRNLAPSARVSASSVRCEDGLCHYAHLAKDTNLDSRTGPSYGWAATTPSRSEWLQLNWPSPVRTDYIEIITDEASDLRNADVQYHDGSQWITIQPNRVASLGVKRTLSFDAISTTALRVTGLVGTNRNLPQLNEILVRRADQPTVNVALNAVARASSTHSGYSAAKANDGNTSTALGGEYSWVNAGWVEPPHWLELAWNTPILTRHLEVFSTDGYALQGFDVQYFVNGDWASVPARSSSTTGAHTSVTFNPVTTYRIRLTNFIGPAIQPGYFRVNEIVVHGMQ